MHHLTQPLCVLLVIGSLILLNAWVSFNWLWKREGYAWPVLGLNIVQLGLFTLVFYQLYLLGGDAYYLVAQPPMLWDWCQLTLVHVVRAMDFMDAIEGYGWQLQNIKSQGYIAGTPIVLLHLLVDFFLFTALYKILAKGRLSQTLLASFAWLFQVLLILAGVALASVLLWHWQEYYPLLLWTGVCAAMVVAIRYWGIELSADYSLENLETRGQGYILMVQIGLPILAALAMPVLAIVWIVWGTELVMNIVGISIMIVVGGFVLLLALSLVYSLLYAIGKIQLVYLFAPIILFTVACGGFGWWFSRLYPEWLDAQGDWVLFALENLFCALDLTDMSPIFGWHWSHTRYNNWIFASVVVSYRCLASAFFYQYVYKLIQLWGGGNILPMDKRVALLRDSRPAVRASVIEELQACQSPELVPYLLPFLQDRDRELQRLALEICQRMGGPEAIGAVVPLCLASDPEIRTKAWQFLQKFDSAVVSPHLLPSLKSDDATVRQLAIASMAHLDMRFAAPAIGDMLHDPVPAVQNQAIQALGQLQATAATDKIIPLLQRPELNLEAIQALGKLGATTAIPHMVALLPDKRLEGEVYLALQTLLPRLTVAEIIAWLAHEFTRYPAVEALHKAGIDTVVPSLLPLLHDQDHTQRRAGLFALGELAAHAAIPKIVPVLQDPETSVRREAVIALGKLDAREAVSTMLRLLYDQCQAVREAVGVVLVKWRLPEAVATLSQLLHDPDPELQKTALDILGKLEATPAIPLIAPLLVNPHLETTAIRALVRLHASGITCAGCGRSQLMEMEPGKYWCSWCNDWARLVIEKTYKK